MFDQIMAAMSKPTTQNPFDYAQRMMECTLRLTQAQMDVMKGLYAEVGQEYAASLASADPAAMLKSWPQLAATTIRAQAETGALLMKNAHKFQTELLEIRQSANPGLSGQIMKDMMEIVRTNGSTRPPVRAKKAA